MGEQVILDKDRMIYVMRCFMKEMEIAGRLYDRALKGDDPEAAQYFSGYRMGMKRVMDCVLGEENE